jgi:hypothetical protein
MPSAQKLSTISQATTGVVHRAHIGGDVGEFPIQEESESLQQAVAKRPKPAGSMNAFELMASALDISAILEDRMESRSLNTRFLSKAQPGIVIQYLEEAATARGGRLVRSNDCRSTPTPPRAEFLYLPNRTKTMCPELYRFFFLLAFF